MSRSDLIQNDLTIVQRAVLKKLSDLKLKPSARVLDAPCGASAALTLALRAQGFSCLGADVDSTAQRRLGDSFAKADLNGPLPWPQESFDATISTEGIEHFENSFAFIRELWRVLKPGGVLILTTPNITALRSRVRFLGSGFFGRDGRPLNESGRHPLHHIGLLTFPELRYELHTSGFQIREVRHTHVKPISYLYAIYAPWMWCYTRIAFRREKDAIQRARNKEILTTLLSRSLLFGECLLILAIKE